MTTPSPHRPANVRALAARTVSRVLRGRSLDDALPDPVRVPVAADAALLRALAYGVLREHALLDAIAQRLLRNPVTDADLDALIRVGLFQLRSMRIPAHAAINETVAATEILHQPQARGLVNAVLRRYLRETESLEAGLPDDPAVRLSHPGWMVQTLRHDWPAQWQSVLAANNQPGPLTLRVNRRRLARDAYLQRLAQMQIDAHPHAHAADGVVLAAARPVDKIPGFNSGQVSVQDGSAQLAADLLDLQPGLSVLDACAAPGGKTAHMLERADVRVTAVDNDARRLTRIDENLRRLRLQADLVAGDAARPDAWSHGRRFDRILVDAPCSGSGVIRRHPDIKWLRRADDIPVLQQQQRAMLAALWPLLAPGGRLVYATCSTFVAEGDDVVAPFAGSRDDAQNVAIDAPWGEATAAGRRIAPDSDHDGFYYAVLCKP